MSSIAHQKANLQEIIISRIQRKMDAGGLLCARTTAVHACELLAARMTLKELRKWNDALTMTDMIREKEATNNLTPNQQKMLDFLKSRRSWWTGPTHIGHEVGSRTISGRRRHSSWASPICKRLVELGLVERNEDGHYRYVQG